MTLPDLLDLFSARGVKISLRLRVEAPRSVLTEEIKAALEVHKPLLLMRLAREAQDARAADLVSVRLGPIADDSSQALPRCWVAPNLTAEEAIALAQVLNEPWPEGSLAESIAEAQRHNAAVLGKPEKRECHI
jgi:hypothetical protein